MAAPTSSSTPGDVRKIEKFVKKFNSLSLDKERMKVVCSWTGHEMPVKIEAVESFVSGKKYQRLVSQRENDLLTKYQEHFEEKESKYARKYLYCKLTGRTINLLEPSHIQRHVTGKRFTKALEKWKECQQQGKTFVPMNQWGKVGTYCKDPSAREAKKKAYEEGEHAVEEEEEDEDELMDDEQEDGADIEAASSSVIPEQDEDEPSSSASSEPTPVKRMPGKPAKKTSTTREQGGDEPSSSASSEPTPVKQKPGKPTKKTSAIPKQDEDEPSSSASSEPTPVKRKPGKLAKKARPRPNKMQRME